MLLLGCISHAPCSRIHKVTNPKGLQAACQILKPDPRPLKDWWSLSAGNDVPIMDPFTYMSSRRQLEPHFRDMSIDISASIQRCSLPSQMGNRSVTLSDTSSSAGTVVTTSLAESPEALKTATRPRILREILAVVLIPRHESNLTE